MGWGCYRVEDIGEFMGSGCEEARALGVAQMERNIKEYGTAVPGNPRYDNNYWQDVTGKTRHIMDMDSMHLCLVVSYLRKGTRTKFKSIRERVMVNELKRRGFTEEDYNFNITGVTMGLYCMYPNEDSSALETYYSNLLRSKGCV